MIELDETSEQRAVIKVIGVGGGGGNAVDAMVENNIQKVEFITANTDVKSLKTSRAPVRIQIGKQLTKGLGAGSKPEVGKKAAFESIEQLTEALCGADMVFIAAGMGGGTGTGAAPVIAEAVRKLDALIVGIVTKPFTYEGKIRGQLAEQGINELKKHVDSLIVIPNDRLIGMADKKMSLFDAFKPSDDVLRQAVQGIAEVIDSTGFINLDFADVQTVMSVRGMAMMGIGMGSGDNRASDAVNAAISSPLLEENDISGAKAVLVNISGSATMTMEDYYTVNRIVHEKVHEDASIKIGVVTDNNLDEAIKVIVIATGFGDKFAANETSEIRNRELSVVGKQNTDRDILDKPAFMRNQKKMEQGGHRESAIFSSEDHEEFLAIPAFLRKKLN